MHTSTYYDVLMVLTILAYFMRKVSRCGEGKAPIFFLLVYLGDMLFRFVSCMARSPIEVTYMQFA